jgi:hypothetical protein
MDVLSGPPVMLQVFVCPPSPAIDEKEKLGVKPPAPVPPSSLDRGFAWADVQRKKRKAGTDAAMMMATGSANVQMTRGTVSSAPVSKLLGLSCFRRLTGDISVEVPAVHLDGLDYRHISGAKGHMLAYLSSAVGPADDSKT